ncbi:MAG: DNA-formamidopyrimidine glycosylase, partial [Actinobacteria bacterium]|nr:DNA-formamidopyrimidine glycosylase [Actinomycetota bacterium]
HRRSRRRRIALRDLLLDGRTVAGVGNIYANEAAFHAGIHPRRPAGRISLARYGRLARALEQVMTSALEAGGTTLRDFLDVNGTPGRYSLDLWVYGRDGEACRTCGRSIRREVLGARSIYYCPRCQR